MPKQTAIPKGLAKKYLCMTSGSKEEKLNIFKPFSGTTLKQKIVFKIMLLYIND